MASLFDPASMLDMDCGQGKCQTATKQSASAQRCATRTSKHQAFLAIPQLSALQGSIPDPAPPHPHLNPKPSSAPSLARWCTLLGCRLRRHPPLGFCLNPKTMNPQMRTSDDDTDLPSLCSKLALRRAACACAKGGALLRPACAASMVSFTQSAVLAGNAHTIAPHTAELELDQNHTRA